MTKFTPIAAAVALVSALSAVPAQADSFFWAINQFRTIQKLNGDTGAVVDSFAVPFGAAAARPLQSSATSATTRCSATPMCTAST